MTPIPSDSSLRRALSVEPAASASLASAIRSRVAVTPQRAGVRWPWLVGPGATEVERRRAQSTRLVLVALLTLVVVAVTAFAGSNLVHRPILGGPITFVRDGVVMAANPATGITAPVAAFAGISVINLQTSKDGRILLWFTPAGQEVGVAARIVEADGRAGPSLTAPAGSVLTVDSLGWSPDGSAVLGGVSVSGVHRLAIFDTRTGQGRLVGPATLDAERAALSPDGAEVAFRGIVLGGSAQAVYVLDLATGAARLVATGPPGYVAAWSGLTWSPDGRTITFEVDQSSNDRPLGIWAVTPADGIVRRLTPTGDAAYVPIWSPDGAWIEYATLVSYGTNLCTSDLYVMRPDGSERRLLRRNGWPAGWLPDDQVLFEVAAQPDWPGRMAEGLPGSPYGGVATIRPDGSALTVIAPYGADEAWTWQEPYCGYGNSPAYQRVP